jgi:hypothetical protein
MVTPVWGGWVLARLTMHKAVRDPRLLVVVMTLAVQAVLISITFPVTEVVSDKALWFNDHALHLYQISVQ